MGVSETTVYVNGRPVVIPDHTCLRGPGPRVVVRFPGPIGSTWASRLAKLGATVEFWCPPYGACVTMTGDADEIIAVAHTGLDTGVLTTIMPDLACRVRALTSWPINPFWAPYVTNPCADDGPADLGSGHGTYVSGLAAGTGARSAGARRGVAPAATLVVQAIEQWIAVAPGHPEIGASRYTLAGRPTDLRELLTQGYRSGARIHVLAWGSAAAGTYDNDSYEAELYLRERLDDVRTTHHAGRHPAIRTGCSPGRHRTARGRRAGCARRPRPSAAQECAAAELGTLVLPS
jgi:hypothetical protein